MSPLGTAYAAAELHGVERPAWAADDAALAAAIDKAGASIHPLHSAVLSLTTTAKTTFIHQLAFRRANKQTNRRPCDKVPVVAFKPRSGVRIETDPKATAAASNMGTDDEAIIEDLLAKLETVRAGFAVGLHECCCCVLLQ
jgi:hypothetical protein